MVGNVLDGHAPGEFQGIAFERTGVVFLGVGEMDFDLAGLAAREAVDAWDLEFQDRRLVADGQAAKRAFDAALAPDVVATALGAAEPFAWLFDAEERRAGLKVLPDIVVADDPEALLP